MILLASANNNDVLHSVTSKLQTNHPQALVFMVTLKTLVWTPFDLLVSILFPGKNNCNHIPLMALKTQFEKKINKIIKNCAIFWAVLVEFLKINWFPDADVSVLMYVWDRFPAGQAGVALGEVEEFGGNPSLSLFQPVFAMYQSPCLTACTVFLG